MSNELKVMSYSENFDADAITCTDTAIYRQHTCTDTAIYRQHSDKEFVNIDKLT